jgi:Polyketide cyclase / dehydrase and lipid transport
MGLRDSTRFWNTTAEEIVADYPAHRYASAPYRPLIRAIDVAASPSVVFRWLCQLKVAPYSYDWLDNGARRSPRELTPGTEKLAEGQRLLIARIVEFEPDRHITAVSLPVATTMFGAMSLTYQVSPTAFGSRLVCCIDVTARSWAGRLRTDLLAAGDLVMMRKQLRNLKDRAECSLVPA